MARESEGCGPSFCRIPMIPLVWLLFFDFAFTFGTTVVYFADIITDILTLVMYYRKEWHYAFGLSLSFIIAPSILLAILECQFLIRAYGKNVKWTTVVLRTVINVPFQLTVIFYHLKLSYNYLTAWLDHVRRPNSDKGMQGNRQMSVSNLADIDDRLGTVQRRAITSAEVPASQDDPPIAYPAQDDHTWWKALTREQWLAHLNKMKLIESMLESLPQLLINVYLIVKYHSVNPVPAIQYISAVLSYLSLCGGVVRYDKTKKDNEAERLMVDRTLLHSRAFATRLEWPQILFVSIYKGSFLAARILAFVYFTVFYSWIILIVIFVHWAALMCYLVYLWYPTDIDKATRQLVQADYKFRAYMFLSQDFIGVFTNSLMGIFISVRPYHYAFLGQPYCYLFWFYLAYIIENVLLYLTPGVVHSMNDNEGGLIHFQYYVIMVFELALNVVGSVVCIIYYFMIHKMHPYTRNAYPLITHVQGLCCCSDLPPVEKEWTICKQAETSEMFFLRREKLKDFRNTYNTIARGNRKKGRTLECFIDDRGEMFYAQRSKLFRRLPSPEEERTMEMINIGSRQNLDNIDEDSPRHTAKEKKIVSPKNAPSEETQALLSEENGTPEISAPVQQSKPVAVSIENTSPKQVQESRDADASDADRGRVDGERDPASLNPASQKSTRKLPQEAERHSHSTRSDPGKHRSNPDYNIERMSQRLPRERSRNESKPEASVQPKDPKEKETGFPSSKEDNQRGDSKRGSHSSHGSSRHRSGKRNGESSPKDQQRSDSKRGSHSSHGSSRHRSERRKEESSPKDGALRPQEVSGSAERRRDRKDDSQRSRGERSHSSRGGGRKRSPERSERTEVAPPRSDPVGQTWI